MGKIFIGFILLSGVCFSQINLVKDIRSGTSGSLLGGFAVYQGQLYFKANNGIDATELWKSDGTASGTVEVADTNPGPLNFNPVNLTDFNSKLYFSGLITATVGSEIFSYDGTTIANAADIRPGPGSSSPGFILPFNGNLYFRALEAVANNYRLYKMTPSNSYSILDNTILIGTTAAVLGSKIILSGGTVAGNSQLYSTDGTAIALVKTINTTGSSSPTNFYTAPVLNKTFFQATDGTNGKELWVTDGTTAGTKMVADINPTGDSSPAEFYEFSGKVYFQAAATTGNLELWSTDGVTASLVKEINSTGSSIPANFLAFNNFLYFSANDGISGTELWKTDGTTANTHLFLDINTGAGSSSPSDLIVYQNTIFLAADDGVTGKELYRISPSALSSKTASKKEFSVFPNPSDGNLSFSDTISGSYLIFSYAGNLIKSGTLINAKNLVLPLIPGNYHLLINSNGSKTSFPLIIKK